MAYVCVVLLDETWYCWVKVKNERNDEIRKGRRVPLAIIREKGKRSLLKMPREKKRFSN